MQEKNLSEAAVSSRTGEGSDSSNLKTHAPEPSEARTETLEHGTNDCNHKDRKRRKPKQQKN